MYTAQSVQQKKSLCRSFEEIVLQETIMGLKAFFFYYFAFHVSDTNSLNINFYFFFIHILDGE